MLNIREREIDARSKDEKSENFCHTSDHGYIVVLLSVHGFSFFYCLPRKRFKIYNYRPPDCHGLYLCYILRCCHCSGNFTNNYKITTRYTATVSQLRARGQGAVTRKISSTGQWGSDAKKLMNAEKISWQKVDGTTKTGVEQCIIQLKRALQIIICTLYGTCLNVDLSRH